MAKRGRPRRIEPLAASATTTESESVKITLTTNAACPDGVALRGTVLDVDEDSAKQFVSQHCARPYDHKQDSKAKHGYTKAPTSFENQ